ncbi:MAG: hypothetical protein J7K21_06035 [Desulfurococcales archaeon]|nr:hypothetical protein [Desulfurococcales archaeon]
MTRYYVLTAKELNEVYGDRPGVIFGNGLVVIKDTILWIGGVGDHIIGIFSTNMDKIIEEINWLKG